MVALSANGEPLRCTHDLCTDALIWSDRKAKLISFITTCSNVRFGNDREAKLHMQQWLAFRGGFN